MPEYGGNGEKGEAGSGDAGKAMAWFQILEDSAAANDYMMFKLIILPVGKCDVEDFDMLVSMILPEFNGEPAMNVYVHSMAGTA